MSQDKINDRRNWKAETFPYDYFIPDDSQECQYCLTEKQVEILLGIIEPLAWSTRWWSDSNAEIVKDDIEQFRNDITRRLMMACCGDEIPVQYRYSIEGVLQRSIDGGATWEDAPEYDPRNNSPQFPPMNGADGDDKKCIAATGAADLLKEQVGDQLTDDMSRYTLNQLITDWVKTMIETSNPFEALLTVIANQIFALVIATLRPALTDDVYENFKCILLCNMNNDATISTEQWSQIRSDITDQIAGIAGIFLEHIVYLLGAGGMTNLIRAGGASSGDCSECDSCDDFLDVFVRTGGGTEDNRDGAVLTASSIPGGPSGHILYLAFGIDEPLDTSKCGKMTINFTSGGGSVNLATCVYQDCGSNVQHNIGASNVPDLCVDIIILAGTAPFTVEVSAVDC